MNVSTIRKSKNTNLSGWKISIAFILMLTAFILNFVYVSIVTSSTKSTKIHDNLGGYYLDIIEDTHNTKWKKKKKELDSNEDENGMSESSVFGYILNRALGNLETITTPCSSTDANDKMSLSGYGIINDISQGLLLSNTNNQQCHLPPDTSCNDNGYTVIILQDSRTNHNIEKKLVYVIEILSNSNVYPLIQEIIFIWNDFFTTSFSSQILEKWDTDDKHPLRIIYNTTTTTSSFPNEYNPNILNTKTNAILYYNINNDINMYNNLTTTIGYELWKRNSGIPIISYKPMNNNNYYEFQPSNNSKHYNDMIQNEQIDKSIELIEKINKNPYIDTTISKENQQHSFFIKFCSSYGKFKPMNEMKDALYVSSLSKGGAFVHVNLLCFLQHSMFQKIRNFVTSFSINNEDILDNSYEYYDIAIGIILSQITGKAPRLYPIVAPKNSEYTKITSEIKDSNQEKQMKHVDKPSKTKTFKSTMDTKHEVKSKQGAKSRNKISNKTKRKLKVRNQDTNYEKIDHFIKSIISYFGSLHPPSIVLSWCDMIKEQDYSNSYHGIPWMDKNGYEYDQC